MVPIARGLVSLTQRQLKARQCSNLFDSRARERRGSCASVSKLKAQCPATVRRSSLWVRQCLCVSFLIPSITLGRSQHCPFAHLQPLCISTALDIPTLHTINEIFTPSLGGKTLRTKTSSVACCAVRPSPPLNYLSAGM